MMEVLRSHGAATPSGPHSPSDIHTPPAPLHGFEDHWEPYTPRKSTRIHQRTQAQASSSSRSRARTPSPQPTPRRHISSVAKQQPSPHHKSTGSPKSTKRQPHHHHHSHHQTEAAEPSSSAMVTPTFTPVKKRAVNPAVDSVHRASRTLNLEGSIHAPGGRSTGAGSLITPAKTPIKPPTERSKSQLKGVTKTLFSRKVDENEAMPSPKKARAKKQSTLDSFAAHSDEEEISIFTDSHERVPVVDDSIDNPFYGTKTTTTTTTTSTERTTTRRSTRNLVIIPGEGVVSLEEAVGRKDGMLIML